MSKVRISIASIVLEALLENKTTGFIIKRVAKRLSKDIDEGRVKGYANQLVREGKLDHVKAAKRYGIRGPKAPDTSAPSKAPKADSKALKLNAKPEKKAKKGYSLKKLAAEFELETIKIRSILKKLKVEKPGEKWVWPKKTCDELKQIRKDIKASLKAAAKAEKAKTKKAAKAEKAAASKPEKEGKKNSPSSKKLGKSEAKDEPKKARRRSKK